MSAVAANEKRGRRSAVDVAERVAYTRELVRVHRDDRASVHADFVEFYGPTAARTVDEYIGRVRREWLADAKLAAPDERAAFLAELRDDLVLYGRAKAWGAHQAARRLQARVLGLDVQTVAVTGGLTLTAARGTTEDTPLTEHEVQLAAEVVERERARLAPPALDSAKPATADPALDGPTKAAVREPDAKAGT